MTDNSLWAPLKDLRWVTDNQTHYMTFTKEQTAPLWHSEAVRLEGEFTAEANYETTGETVIIDEDFFRDLRGKLLAALDESELRAPEVRDIDDNDDLANVLRDTYRLLTAQFGLQMVILLADPTNI